MKTTFLALACAVCFAAGPCHAPPKEAEHDPARLYTAPESPDGEFPQGSLVQTYTAPLRLEAYTSVKVDGGWLMPIPLPGGWLDVAEGDPYWDAVLGKGWGE